MPELTEKRIMEEQWPPMVQMNETLESGDEPEVVQMTELDVSWMLATVLKMKWTDVQGITDDLERRFLYNKAMWIAQAMNEESSKLEEKKSELEAQLDAKIQSLTNQQEAIAAHQTNFGEQPMGEGDFVDPGRANEGLNL